jgi:LacI family transcriptional regulator
MPKTIRDVARALNLSITTVSRALDGYDDVAESTRQLVLSKAHEMGYSPNRAARQLRRQTSETIGFILPATVQRIADPFFMEFIAGLGDELAASRYDLLIANATSEEMERELYERWIEGHKVDGFILNLTRLSDWRVQFLSGLGIPFASLERSNDSADSPSVHVDGMQAYADLVNHMREKGFHRFAFIGGHEDLVNHVNRQAWFEQAVCQAGMGLDPAQVVLSDLTFMGGYDSAKNLLSLSQPPDAILCIDDETALGALRAAHEIGLEIGTKIGIAGFGGTLAASHAEPSLTTLDIPIYEIARDLVRLLLARVKKATPGERTINILPNLQVRSSTGG